MTRLFYSVLAILLLFISFADAQRSIGRGQSPLTGRGGGSPLGPSNTNSGGSATNAVATIQTNGAQVATGVTTLNFTNSGSALSATVSGNTVTVNVPATSGSGTSTNYNFDTNAFTVTDTTNVYSKAPSAAAQGLEFWDDFNREVTNSPGIAPSGHPYKFDATIGRNSNAVFTTGGYFKIATNATYGPAYWYVENTNGNSKWNRFGGSFRYLQHSDPNGFQDLLGFLWATNSSLSGNWLHVGVNLQGFYIQKQLGAYLLNETYPTILQTDTEHNFEIIIENDTIFARVAGYQYIIRDDSITNYNNGTMVFYEHNRNLTNLVAQYRGEWGSAFAGQAQPFYQLFAQAIRVGTNGAIIELNAANGVFSGRVTNSATSGGGFWTADASGFVSMSSPSSYMVFAQPQGGIFSTDDNWVLANANSTKTIISLSTNVTIVESNFWIKGDAYIRGKALPTLEVADTTLLVTNYYGSDKVNSGNSGFVIATIGTNRWTIVGVSPNWGAFVPAVSNFQDIGSWALPVKTNYANQFQAKTGISIEGSGSVGAAEFKGTNGISVTIQAANSNSIYITNIVGLLHKASASVITLDCNHGNKFQITNQLGQATSIIVTNLSQGQEISISGDADGTSRVVTIIPHLGYLVRDFDTFGVAAAANKAITATNGNTFEINIAAKWSFGTNFADIVTRQAKY